ncbi:MAG: substrate-binding domain-containing protein, partial [Prolixibacteraceae bacterium]|nr:substrate-binding domain-containing protein [Prolixibacteraceae bacterium]
RVEYSMTNQLKKNSISLKEDIRNWILLKIQNKEWLSGEKILSISEIAAKFKVSRETVRLSLENLVQRGILQPRQGLGYFVSTVNKINIRVALLCKIDGLYIKPIYQGLIDEREETISIQVNEIRQSAQNLIALLEDFITRQAIDRILVIPVPGEEDRIDKILKPFKRRIKIGWIDKAPAKTKDPVFLCDYEASVNIAINHFRNNNIDQLFYYSRNKEDLSVYATMRKTFKKALAENGKTNEVIPDWQHILSIVNEQKEPVGIMAESDADAAYLVSRLKANGIKIPNQLSIISCDNSEITELITPSITSVDPGFIEVGRKVREWIQGEFLNDGGKEPIVFYSTPFLIRKESSV